MLPARISRLHVADANLDGEVRIKTRVWWWLIGGWYRTIYLSIYLSIYIYIKFRSQTSDNMDRWKSRDGKSQRKEEKKEEDQERESLRRKKIQVREKVGKSRDAVFFQWFVAPEGRKVGSLKRRVRSHVVRWQMKSCTPLWREARFQVKMYKAPQLRSTFRSWDV